MRKLHALVLVIALAGCNDGDGDVALSVLQLNDKRFTYCCDPRDPVPPGGYYVGRVRIRTDYGVPVWVKVSSSTTGAIEVVIPGVGPVQDGESFRIDGDGTTVLEFDLYSHVCNPVSAAEQKVSFFAYLHPDGVPSEYLDDQTVTVVREDCPEPEPFPYLILPACVPGERTDVVPEPGQFGAGAETVTGAPGSASICCEDGTPLQTLLVPALNGVRALFRSVTGSPQLAQASFASEAIVGYGPSMIAISVWVPANDAFGMVALAGAGDNWTDVAPAGDPQATDLYMAVGFTGRQIVRIAPGQLTGQWTFGGAIVQPNVFDAAWGGPVTACRLERTGDIVTAHEPSLTEPGNLVVVSMGGDDVGDSAAVVGQTGLRPRVLRGLDGILAVTCFGEDKLSIFRRTATGYEKLGDETVGDGPLGLSVKRLANGNVALLSTGSRDDTWSVTIVDPATGAVTTTTRAVPAELDEPTDCDWGEGDDAYVLGKASGNIARIDSGVQ